MPHTRRIKRALTCELEHKTQSNTHQNNIGSNQTIQPLKLPDDEKDADWLHTNQQLNEIAITNPTTSELCIPIFSAINLKKKKKKKKKTVCPNGLEEPIYGCTHRFESTR